MMDTEEKKNESRWEGLPMPCHDCMKMACKLEGSALPDFCPGQEKERIERANEILKRAENHALFHAAALVESEGYLKWTRVEEVIRLMGKLSFTRLGIAYCTGLKKEAQVFARIAASHGLQVFSLMCKAGGTPKEAHGITEEQKVRPYTHEVICNPVAQALYLNDCQTEYNVIIGLCLGHDALFAKYANAPTSTLVAKDRALANNPCAALYCADGYLKRVWGDSGSE